MLIFSRYVGGQIMIGENICITVKEIQCGYVRIEVQAPENTKIQLGQRTITIGAEEQQLLTAAEQANRGE